MHLLQATPDPSTCAGHLGGTQAARLRVEGLKGFGKKCQAWRAAARSPYHHLPAAVRLPHPCVLGRLPPCPSCLLSQRACPQSLLPCSPPSCPLLASCSTCLLSPDPRAVGSGCSLDPSSPAPALCPFTSPCSRPWLQHLSATPSHPQETANLFALPSVPTQGRQVPGVDLSMTPASRPCLSLLLTREEAALSPRPPGRQGGGGQLDPRKLAAPSCPLPGDAL